MYLSELRPDISQGDIFVEVPFPYFANTENLNDPKPSYLICTVMLISHSCDYDKPNSKFCLVAQIRPISELNPNSHGNLRKEGLINTIYLPRVTGKIDESYVDLRNITSIQKIILSNQAANGKRILSVTDDYLRGVMGVDPALGLWNRLSYFFGPRKDDLDKPE